MFQMCSTPPRNILNAEHTTSKYFKRAAHPRNVSNVQHTTPKKLRRAAHHLEIFSDQIREYVPNDLSFAVAWALTLYRCRGNYGVIYCMGRFCLSGRGMLMSLCRGPVHQASYMRLSTSGLIYIRTIHPACWLPALHTLERTWCGRWRKLWTRRYGRRNNRTVYTHTSKPSQP